MLRQTLTDVFGVYMYLRNVILSILPNNTEIELGTYSRHMMRQSLTLDLSFRSRKTIKPSEVS